MRSDLKKNQAECYVLGAESHNCINLHLAFDVLSSIEIESKSCSKYLSSEPYFLEQSLWKIFSMPQISSVHTVTSIFEDVQVERVGFRRFEAFLRIASMPNLHGVSAILLHT
jgi:hypothetical protein